LFALIAKTLSNLLDAVNELKVLIKELSTNLNNTEKLVSKLDQRLTRAEKNLQSIELNCANSGHLSNQEE
jgi:septal ring factor EnvC (AmiA/AmiB activator)